MSRPKSWPLQIAEFAVAQNPGSCWGGGGEIEEEEWQLDLGAEEGAGNTQLQHIASAFAKVAKRLLQCFARRT